MSREMEWLEQCNFSNNPFEKFTAENDKNLVDKKTFIEFPYFEQLEKPETTFLFIKRGLGKTANRLMLEKRIDGRTENIQPDDEMDIVIPHDDFSDFDKTGPATLEYHVEKILKNLIKKLRVVSMQEDRIKFIENLNYDLTMDYIFFLKKYSDFFNEYSLKQLIRTILKKQNIDKEKRDKWINMALRETLETLSESVKNVYINKVSKLLLTFDDINKKTDVNSDKIPGPKSTPLEKITRIAEVARNLKIGNIFVLVDKIDDYLGKDGFQDAFKLIFPLIHATPILQNRPFSFKFFIPYEIFDDVNKEGRLDKFSPPDLQYKWQDEKLRDLLSKRIYYSYSDKPFLDNLGTSMVAFENLFENDIANVVDGIIESSDSSPRNLITICNMIFAEHTGQDTVPDKIAKDTYENAMKKYQQKKQTG